MFGQRFLEPLGLLGAALLGQPLADPVERRRQPVLLDRLHQIIDRLRLERAQGMFVIGGDEHEQGRLDLHHPRNHRETVEAGHLDVEEDEVGLVGLDRPDRLAAVGGGGDDFHVVMRLQAQAEALRRQRLIVDEDGADGH